MAFCVRSPGQIRSLDQQHEVSDRCDSSHSHCNTRFGRWFYTHQGLGGESVQNPRLMNLTHSWIRGCLAFEGASTNGRQLEVLWMLNVSSFDQCETQNRSSKTCMFSRSCRFCVEDCSGWNTTLVRRRWIWWTIPWKSMMRCKVGRKCLSVDEQLWYFASFGIASFKSSLSVPIVTKASTREVTLFSDFDSIKIYKGFYFAPGTCPLKVNGSSSFLFLLGEPTVLLLSWNPFPSCQRERLYGDSMKGVHLELLLRSFEPEPDSSLQSLRRSDGSFGMICFEFFFFF